MSRVTLLTIVGGAAAIAAASVGCDVVPDQSTLHPAGPAAAEIARLSWVMFVVFTLVFALVVALLIVAIRGRTRKTNSDASGAAADHDAPPWGRTGFIVAGGVVLPILILTPLYLYSLITSAALRMPSDAVTVRVVGHMWWWEVRYPEQGIVSANEIYIPVGKPVRLELTSVDVIHSLWIPRLNGKRDLIPGNDTVFWLQADEPGVFRGQCAEYCGTQHANMALEVIALEPDDFAAWTAARLRTAPEPTTTATLRGRELFRTAGCVQCHAVRGLSSSGNIGPDLTHLRNRRKLGGAMLDNTRENLKRWIIDAPSIKPGVKMPRTQLPAEAIDDLVAYLESLE